MQNVEPPCKRRCIYTAEQPNYCSADKRCNASSLKTHLANPTSLSCWHQLSSIFPPGIFRSSSRVAQNFPFNRNSMVKKQGAALEPFWAVQNNKSRPDIISLQKHRDATILGTLFIITQVALHSPKLLYKYTATKTLWHASQNKRGNGGVMALSIYQSRTV